MKLELGLSISGMYASKQTDNLDRFPFCVPKDLIKFLRAKPFRNI